MKTIAICLVIVCFVTAENGNKKWPNHDISTLKLLQLVHRHADRSPLSFAPKDPYKDITKYWGQGFGELTNKGKYRMYKWGQWIREEYNDYFGDKYSPREVYVRSSLTERCIESTSSLLAGAYPPNQKAWQWNIGSDAPLGNVWQPFPIETFMPHSADLVCNEEKHCPIVDKERSKIYERTEVKQFVEKNKELYRNVSQATGWSIKDIGSASAAHDELYIEYDVNYVWNKTWTKDEEKRYISQLLQSHAMQYQLDWDSPIIKRLRGGGLVKELNNNFQKVMDNKNNKKLYIYSTHDSVLGAVMNALNIWTGGQIPTFGSTILFELHQKNDTKDYFVRVLYQNQTGFNTDPPHHLQWGDCKSQYDCPYNDYIESTKHLHYSDFDHECKQSIDIIE
ncbi:prostatic acid phosphatase-like [Oppia nitens]|uniref:prostatic acid phosphatase-like n=1 Tax=Oppia nitens TaxID=1686743 RepID=UPI0023DAED00|nr:prostatic acid phosphatase-like [Oppia nitens]